ncbi:MAG: hypothetical protein AB7T63_08250 [Planctomycetota bacterium]
MGGQQDGTATGSGGADASSRDTRPWRLRHPVLSRSLLYGVGIALLVGLVMAWAGRRAADEADRHLALQKKLENLSIPLQQDPSGTVVLRALAEDYPLDGLPEDLRGLHHRMRALALVSAGRLDEAIEAGKQAIEAGPAGLARELARVEHARMLLRAERGEQALEGLGPAPSAATLSAPGVLPMVLAWRAQAEATVAARAGRQDEAAGHLARAFRGLPDPVDPATELFFEGHDWSAGEIAFALARDLADLQDPSEAAGTWRRLLRIAPADARVAVEAAVGLEAAGAPTDAETALGRARDIDPVAAASYLTALLPSLGAERAAALRALAQNAALPLKSSGPGAR